MRILKIYSEKNTVSFIKKRTGETKFGEKVSFVDKLEDLKNHSAKYVLLGVPEDIGVRANYGNPGTSKAWEAALKSFLNIQENDFAKAENIILLGEIDCDSQLQEAENLSLEDENYVEKLGELVSQIDHKVSFTVKTIIESGKFPIIIGGGHNNSYGNLKGTSEALKTSANCLNFDAHTDFRALGHRHSGNGFSYAFEDGYLNRYFIFGLHRNYTPQFVFDKLVKLQDRVKFSLFEDIAINEKLSFSEGVQEAELFVCNAPFGLELDLDAIEDMGSSAMTPGGFSINDARKFISYFSKKEHCVYFHICEGAPQLGNFPAQVGKTISFLISDVIA
jgi:formiminoglutamase